MDWSSGIAIVLKGIFASKSLREQKYSNSVDRLCSSQTYIGRVSGAVQLAELSARYPEEFSNRVLKIFQAFLQYPSRYGAGNPNAGRVDYNSTDTMIIVKSLNDRTKEDRIQHKVHLPEYCPFILDDEYKVVPNPRHADFELSKLN